MVNICDKLNLEIESFSLLILKSITSNLKIHSYIVKKFLKKNIN